MDISLKAQVTKEQMDKSDFMKILFLICSSKGTIDRVKIQSTGWEKIFANCISGKGLISRIYNELKLNNKKTNSPV